MRYSIEGFSQIEAVKFRRTEIVKRKNPKTGTYEDKETVVALDCTDLVILRWFVDFWPNMMKVEISGQQYAWLSYKAAIEDMPLLGIKKGMFALRLKKLVDFGILSHQTVRNGGTFSYYGFGPEYARLVDSKHSQQTSDPAQNISEPLHNKLETPAQKISDQIDPNTKDPSTKDNPERVDTPTQKQNARFKKPTIEEVTAYCKERNNGIDPQYFIDYQNARGWILKGGQPMKDWKATIRTWERMEGKFSERKPTQRKLNLSEHSEPRIGSMRTDNRTEKTEVYRGNGVWEEYVSDYVPQEGDVDIEF